MKSLTGREYEVVVKTETETLSLKEYENRLGGKKIKSQKLARIKRRSVIPTYNGYRRPFA